ncbi:hypothetical protein KPH14_006435 [Odynerus spinipes]|uniref:Uncharacterized protein n=1 Tax=Odynerus spinipes TaxID=1348599 RepID=A0AAD9RRE3_9HYME|nr:hypothetical protein KPH14_006435 [Odynerus spinipes]
MIVVRVALYVVALSFLIFIPSSHGEESNRRLKRGNGKLPPGLSGGGPPGHNRGGPPGHYDGGPPGYNRGGPPGLSGGGPPGHNRGGPPGHNKGKPSGWKEKDDFDNEGGPRPWDTDNNYGQQGRKCRTDEFQCGNDDCLPIRWRCNGNVECRDGSDERNCVRPPSSRSGCVLPPQPESGEYKLLPCDAPCRMKAGDKVPIDSILVYSCHDRSVLRGNASSTCIDNEWSEIPTCEKTCSPLESTTVDISCTYQERTVSCSEHVRPGTRAKLSCKQSYNLPPNYDPVYREIVCLENAIWDRTAFECLPACGIAVPYAYFADDESSKKTEYFFPWFVGVYERNPKDEYQHICGGSLISNDLVLSAAHCFYDETRRTVEDSSRYYVAAGKYYRSWETKEKYTQKLRVEKVILRDRYIGLEGNYAADIAILKLVKPFDLSALVGLVCLDWDNVYEDKQLQSGHVGKVVGWGKQIDGTYSETLQDIDVPYVSYNQCLTIVPLNFRGYITSDKFCAGNVNGTNLCEGHSGSGLFFKMQGLWYVRGIVSVSPRKSNTCDYNSYVGFTYVSHFRDWIRSIYLL